VRWKIVDDDNVPAMQCRDKAAFNIGEEAGSVHRSVNYERGNDPIMAQTRHQRDGLPVPVWNRPDQSFTTGAAAPKPHHVGTAGSFVDEHQPGGVQHELRFPPAPACGCHIAPLLFGGVQGFF
jgi:hypothetical protein